MNRILSILVPTALVLTLVGIADAYQVSPMIYDMQPSGQGASAVIRVNNTNSSPITIEMVAEKRLFDEAGKESREPADQDFVLFPPQAIVQPGATQAVRIQYVGQQKLDQSSTYTVTVKQVPVQLPNDGKSGVQFVFNFSTVANIVPAGAKASVEATSVEATGKTLKVTLHNSGNKYANLALSSLDISGGSFTKTIKDEAWKKALGTSWILPGGSRIVEVPKPDKAPSTGLSAKFNFVEAKP
ncbi:MAG: fimbria/pilus periplasmic chaperone [Micropepsaceae bacterium]